MSKQMKYTERSDKCPVCGHVTSTDSYEVALTQMQLHYYYHKLERMADETLPSQEPQGGR